MGPFLVIFAQWGFFPKTLVLTHTAINGPLTPGQVSEKTNEPIPRKLTDRPKDVRKGGWKDVRTDGLTLFYRSLPEGAGVQ